MEKTPNQEKMAEEDMFKLERAFAKKQLAEKDVQRANAEQEAADLSYRNVVLQLFMKYGLTEADSINNDGTFTRKVVQAPEAQRDQARDMQPSP